MSTHQRAVINGLLAENFGKNELVRQSQLDATIAQGHVQNAQHQAEMLRIDNQKLMQENKLLKEKIQKNEDYEKLLSRPMKDIAAINGDFRKTYEMQQELLAEWVLAQRAYKETATQLGIQLGKTPDEVQQMASQNANAVLENKTQHGNDATTSPLLNDYASAIIAMRKKNGKM